ncbi:MAG: ion transporter [Beijerinckiaceae bacterium]
MHERRLLQKLRSLYYGDHTAGRRFRYGLIAFDIFTILVFVIEAIFPGQWWAKPVDITLGMLLIGDFLFRLYVERNRRRFLLHWSTLADLVVIVSLLAPLLTENLAFLRVVRALRLLRSYQLLRDLRAESAWFRSNENVIQASVNFFVFLFVVTSIVFVTQSAKNAGINTYVDALYFTVTTLTTTGFGDITLKDTGGKLLSVLIMIVGVSLFLQLIKAIFRPPKVRFTCDDCGLLMHDRDAVHCKHCGKVLAIPSDGDDL